MEIENSLITLEEIVERLCNPRRVKIMNCLGLGRLMKPKTFKELQKDTKISTGSLHYHLQKLLSAGFIGHTNERPREYYTTSFLEWIVDITRKIKNK